MTVAFCVDEHVPSVFVTTLRSNGYDVVTAADAVAQGPSDRRLLEYCAEEGHVLVTHDKKDFAGAVGDAIEHSGIVIYTDTLFLRRTPGNAVRTLERVLDHYPPSELAGEQVWLDQWRE
ncbi:DUF5615 family PIN-like protein [Halalkaliarchaeum sp. AArc-GB]|uniref:DUF5615 family PIN-like protein n=1 Tax=Halalkaliarchaeum sp. AArc-GB TaxID=3074078 RepID=UPI002864EC4B|nr:DUF5615 family PIN-like protein [Halalkaliarchaeum sp. AArc-GB]MDR5673654.1 DUF5615 family PIN-like protein [Halalkaliarchaeum sp. AArc-GB]